MDRLLKALFLAVLVLAVAGAAQRDQGAGGVLAGDGTPAVEAALQVGAAARRRLVGETDEESGSMTTSEDPVVEASTSEALDSAVEKGSQAQAKKARVKARVVNKLVAQEEGAELANGDGDVSTTGACAGDVAALCRKARPGAGRLAECLAAVADAEPAAGEEAASTEDGSPLERVSKACRAELDAFRQDAAKNVNKDVPLAKACARDVAQHCASAATGQPGAVLACLRAKAAKLLPRCRKEVKRTQQAAADDFRLDTALLAACAADKSRLCADVAPHGGAVQACLRDSAGSLSWECKRQLFRQEMEDSGDLRLSVALLRKCLRDKRTFCAEVDPGQAAVTDCLEAHRGEAGFSGACRGELEGAMAARAANFRLDVRVRRLCAPDIGRLCGLSAVAAAGLEADEPTPADDAVTRCLQDYRAEIADAACKARVQRLVALGAEDIRFNAPLTAACAADQKRHCAGVAPGGGKVIACLTSKRVELSAACQDVLFKTEVSASESIDLQFPLKEACGEELRKECKGVPHSDGRAIRCLQRLADEKAAAVGEACMKALEAHAAASAADYRLNFRLAEACNSTVGNLCATACPELSREAGGAWGCRGRVLRCLTDRLEQISDEGCAAEVGYLRKMQTKDWRNDVILAEACRDDAAAHCASAVRAGSGGRGAVLACLGAHRDSLSAACRREETRTEIFASTSIELRPGVATACAAERAAHCESVKPGRARVLNCLLARAAAAAGGGGDDGPAREPGAPPPAPFSPQCLTALGAMAERRLLDWRLNFGLREACSPDVTRACGAAVAAAEKLDGVAFTCLVDAAGGGAPGSKAAAGVGAACAREVSRAAATALVFYKPGLPAASACDADISALCPAEPGSPGVHACLASKLAEQSAPQRSERLPARQSLPERRLAAQKKKGGKGRGRGKGGAGAAVDPTQPTLSEGCAAFMRVAARKDDRAAFDVAFTAAAVLPQLASVEAKMGLKAGTLLREAGAAGEGELTITGWAALLCAAALVVTLAGSALYAYRRATGRADPGGYRVVKGTGAAG